jgi:hypothetical protein
MPLVKPTELDSNYSFNCGIKVPSHRQVSAKRADPLIPYANTTSRIMCAVQWVGKRQNF